MRIIITLTTLFAYGLAAITSRRDETPVIDENPLIEEGN